MKITAMLAMAAVTGIGADHHSASGVMKARWESEDVKRLSLRALPFTDVDVRLIRMGLAMRESRMLARLPVAAAPQASANN